jgi:NAD(P)-dependent dehydrogenase (short-subunit alcohol dehydrogenase family)
MRIRLIAVTLALAGSLSVSHAQDTAPAQRAVLVTGASTGIGHKITERLTAAGYFVYAGARKDTDLVALNAMKNVQALRLDVTRKEDIDSAVATVTKAGRGLHGLVNNAGVATPGPLADLTMDEFDLQMKVNVYGPVRMVKAFLPLLVASKGRITNIGSISGILAGKDLNAYAMTKHAMEAFTDSLAAELAPQGIVVNIVEPGNFNSEIGASATKRTGMQSRMTDRSRYKQPDEVAAAVQQALFDANPKRRYMVTPDQREAEITIRKQLEQLVQLNEGQPYTYERDTLVKMLDETLAQARQ